MTHADLPSGVDRHGLAVSLAREDEETAGREVEVAIAVEIGRDDQGPEPE